jgi:competence protein ComEC
MEDPSVEGELDSHVFKAPHHGSHEFAREFLEAVHPQISVISSGETPDHGHPRANFLGTVGHTSRSNQPLIFSTELVALFIVDADAAAPDADDDVDPTDPAMLGQARRRFKKRLNGLINVRTDGNRIYCARRVAAGYQFVTYDQPAAPRYD